MNKKKKALSLGLAAAQLAAFAPAFSQVAFATSTVTVTSISPVTVADENVDGPLGENGQKVQEANTSSITAENDKWNINVPVAKLADTHSDGTHKDGGKFAGKKSFGFKIDLNLNNSADVVRATHTLAQSETTAWEEDTSVAYGIVYSDDTTMGKSFSFPSDGSTTWSGAGHDEAWGDVVFGDDMKPTSMNVWFCTDDFGDKTERDVIVKLVKLTGSDPKQCQGTRTVVAEVTLHLKDTSASATATAIESVTKPSSISETAKDWAGNIAHVTDVTFNETDKTCKIKANIGKMKKAKQEGDGGKESIESFPLVVTFDAPIPANTLYGEYKINTGDTGKIDWCGGSGENTAVFWVDASWVDATDGVTFTLNGDNYVFTVEDVQEEISSVSFTIDNEANLKAGDTLKVTVAEDAPYTAGISIGAGDKAPDSDPEVLAEGDNAVCVTLTPKPGYKFGTTAPEVTDWIGSIMTATADGKAKAIYQKTITIAAEPTAAIAVTSTGLTNATYKLYDENGAELAADATVKKDDKITVKVTPAEGYEFLTAPKYAFNSGSATDLTIKDDIYSVEITIPEISDGTTELPLTLTGEATKKPVVNVVNVHKGVENAKGMNGTYGNYNDNLTKYDVSGEDKDGVYTITVSAQFGAMKGKTTAGSDGKNVLLVLEMEENVETTVWHGASEETDSRGNANTFLVNASGTPDDTKYCKSIWLSVTEARLAEGYAGERFTLKSGNVSKDVVVKFVDTTEYAIDASGIDQTAYSVEAAMKSDNKTATITVTPKGDNIVSGGTITLKDSNTIALTSQADGSWTADVEVKKLLDATTEIEQGDVEANLVVDTNIAVTTIAKSTVAVADKVELAVADPGTMTDTTNYDNNRNLIIGNVSWDANGNVTTVKVPSALLKGKNESSSVGTDEKNICLVMKFKSKLTKNDGAGSDKYGVEDTQIQDIDIENGYKYAGATADQEGFYAVLWINASHAAMTNGKKTVIYKDGDGNAITTVNLVEIPVLTAADVTVGSVTLNGANETANKTLIENAVKDALTDKAELVDITVGTLPTEDGDVTVTITSLNTENLVLADNNAKAESIEITVPVTIAKYTVTLPGSSADGSVTADLASAAAGKKVTLTVTPADGKELGTLTIKDASENVIEYTEEADGTYTFTMPASNVTVSATFVEEVVEVEIVANDITITGTTTGLEVGDNVPTITVGTSTKFTSAVKILNASGTAVTGKFTATGTYTAEVTLTPETGNRFSVTVPKVEGWTGVKDSGNAVYTKTFTVAAASVKPQTAPAAPTMKSRSKTSITLNTIAANANGAAAEYSKDGKTWQSSPTFTGLTKNTTYTFYARYAAVKGFTASPASKGTEIKTSNTSSGGSSSGGGSSWRPSSGGSSSGGSSSSGTKPADSSSTTTPNITNDTADDIDDVIDTTPTAANLSKITDTAEDVEKALKNISKPTVIEKQAATVLEAAIKEAKAAVTAADKAACAENIQLIMKALSTKAPKVLGDADNSGKVDSDDVLLSVLNFRKYRTNAAGQLYSAVVMGVTNKTAINTNDILAFIKAFRTR